MKRLAVLLSVLAGLAPAVPAMAQVPAATPTSGAYVQKVHISGLRNISRQRNGTSNQTGSGCIAGPGGTSAQTAVNPITGKAQTAPIIEIPLNKGGGSVASATTHAQHAHGCAHTR